jgi:hypothetical protein
MEEINNLADVKEEINNLADVKEEINNLADVKEEINNLADVKEEINNLADVKEEHNNLPIANDKATILTFVFNDAEILKLFNIWISFNRMKFNSFSLGEILRGSASNIFQYFLTELVIYEDKKYIPMLVKGIDISYMGDEFNRFKKSFIQFVLNFRNFMKNDYFMSVNYQNYVNYKNLKLKKKSMFSFAKAPNENDIFYGANVKN